MLGVLTCISVIMAVLFVLMIIAFVHFLVIKAPTDFSSSLKKIMTLTANIDKKTAFKMILEFAPNRKGYSICNFDENKCFIALSFTPPVHGALFFYPIQLEDNGSGTTIKIGVIAKHLEFGPITRHLEKCVNDIRAIFAAKT
jgi:hypothetical protein